MVVEHYGDHDENHHHVGEYKNHNESCDETEEVSSEMKDVNKQLTHEDLSLLCDLFYLPFEHGGQGIQLLQEFNWLKSNAHIVIQKSKEEEPNNKPDVS